MTRVAELVSRIAPRLGITVQLEPEHGFVGQLVLPDGRRRYFRDTHFDLNPEGAAEIARDKDYTAFFLRRLGYPVPEGRTFLSDAWCRQTGSDRDARAAYRYARELGFPVMVKPNSKSQGIGVAKAYTRRDLERALRVVFGEAQDRVALVQRVVPGDDYRLVVLDDAVMAAYRRVPLPVIGDGAASIRQLLEQRWQALAARGRRVALTADDTRITSRLRRLGLTLESIPAPGRRLSLLESANLSLGGDLEDLTDQLHPAWRDLAISVTRDLGLRYAGVDVLTDDLLDRPPARYTILELNSGPGLRHYAAAGEPQRLRVEALYEQLLRKLVEAP